MKREPSAEEQEKIASAIAENVYDEQPNFVKYNYLVANLVTFPSLATVTRALGQLPSPLTKSPRASVSFPRLRVAIFREKDAPYDTAKK